MKRLSNPMKFFATLAVVALAFGCATQQTEKLLSTAGFKTRSLSSPTAQQHLTTLQPGKITSVKRGGKTYYVFPDPARNQLYVGGEAQYQKYRQLRAQQRLAEEEMIEKHEDEMLQRMLED
jgi:hypothetical protein